MRVIAGTARGRRLAPVPGEGTRPVTDRTKEALFSILGGDMTGLKVLDLFAGTGGIGIEALSRGAVACDFVELAPKAVRTIHANLAHTRLDVPSARVHRRDVLAFLGARPGAAYDVVYVAPPQYLGLWRATLEALDAAPGWVAPDGVVVVQIDPREDTPARLAHFHAVDRRTYGSTRLVFYAPGPAEEEPTPPSDAPDGEPAPRFDSPGDAPARPPGASHGERDA